MKNRNNLVIYLLLACVVFFYLIIAAVLTNSPLMPVPVHVAAPPPVHTSTPSPVLPVIGLFAAVIAIGYILGSLPFGLWISLAFTGKDVRKVGSGKIGMTNVMRVGGKKWAFISLALDMAKSAFAVLCASLIFGSGYVDTLGISTSLSSIAMVVAALTAIAGHNWSIFLKFKGGRGVATFIGGLIVMYWPAAVISGILTLVIGFRTRYMSMGSIIGAVFAFILLMTFSILQITFLNNYPPAYVYMVYAMVGAIFIYVIHRDNVVRLLSGTERKIGEKSDGDQSGSLM
ncbi:MAG TPA: glycerol-3-phosphate 1-O-acyltransferase PlsY [Dehalococcoidales bacterium]|nr:glycerol-3-phosphate 1-O-acyltransferase PlsY [Dehalococcoidales bacterium]